MNQADLLADRLRRKDAQLRGAASVLDWGQLQEPERTRWLLMADEAVSGVLSSAHARYLREREETLPRTEAFV